MFQEFFARSDMLVWPLIGLLIFLSVFAGVLAYTFFGLRDKNKLADIAAMPLEDDHESASPAEGRAR
jgi:cbb3-type cytochrome oxidase subunit 3